MTDAPRPWSGEADSMCPCCAVRECEDGLRTCIKCNLNAVADGMDFYGPILSALRAKVEQLQAERDVAIDGMKGADELLDEREARVAKLEEALRKVVEIVCDCDLSEYETLNGVADTARAALADTPTATPTPERPSLEELLTGTEFEDWLSPRGGEG